MPTTEVLDWINQRFIAVRTAQEFYHAESFFLIWNIFEKKVANGHTLTIPMIKHFVTYNQNAINQHQQTLNAGIQTSFTYFCQRYVTNDEEQANDLFNGLGFRTQEREHREFLLDTLRDINPSVSMKLLGLLIIAYRIRNNTFHGTKQLPEVVEQQETFQHLNQILMAFLSCFPEQL